jgi:hypothetical protein
VWWWVAVNLIILHSVDGREISVNPTQVTKLTAEQPAHGNKLLPGEVHCVVNLADGKFVSVVEPCFTVRRMIEENGK